MTVEVPPGKEECFFETVPAGNTLSIEYQVCNSRLVYWLESPRSKDAIGTKDTVKIRQLRFISR
jgi:hypothetical protein